MGFYRSWYIHVQIIVGEKFKIECMSLDDSYKLACIIKRHLLF